MMSEKKYLSIIIPAYNEQDRIGDSLSKIQQHLKSVGYDYEVIVVDDGSTDDTKNVVLESLFGKSGKIQIVSNGKNRGKGFSVRNGILNSSGKYVLITDADLSTPFSEVDQLISVCENGYDMVIGSRALKESNVKVHQPWYREIMGKVFNALVKIFVMRGINDTQCGFKLIKGKEAREIAEIMRIDGFCFDVEMLFFAKNKGLKIKEKGVVWINSPQSKVKIFDSSFIMFLDLFRIIRRKSEKNIET